MAQSDESRRACRCVKTNPRRDLPRATLTAVVQVSHLISAGNDERQRQAASSELGRRHGVVTEVSHQQSVASTEVSLAASSELGRHHRHELIVLHLPAPVNIHLCVCV